MNNNTLVLVMGFLGTLLVVAFSAITLLVPGDKTLAYVGLGAVAGLFIPHLMTLKVSADNAVKLETVEKKIEANTIVTVEAKLAAVESTAASIENAQTLAAVSAQQATALEEQAQSLKEVGEKATKAADGVQVVKSIVDGWRTAMEQQNASLRASVEDLKVTLAHERAVTPPAPDSPPPGSTPPHGHPIVEIPPPEGDQS